MTKNGSKRLPVKSKYIKTILLLPSVKIDIKKTSIVGQMLPTL